MATARTKDTPRVAMVVNRATAARVTASPRADMTRAEVPAATMVDNSLLTVATTNLPTDLTNNMVVTSMASHSMAKTHPDRGGMSPVQPSHLSHTKLTMHRSYDQSGPGGAQEGERGLGGAVAGGLAGGFAGHKADHGFLGTIGGAIVGSIAEDAMKKHHNKDKEQENPYGQQGYGQGGYGQQGYGQGYPPSNQGGSGGMMDKLGNFFQK